MDKNELKKIWDEAEAKRMALVEKIKEKRNQVSFSFAGSEIPDSVIDEYNNLVNEHNRIVDVQDSIRDSVKEYIAMTGDNSFGQEFLNAGGGKLKNWAKKTGEKVKETVKNVGEKIGETTKKVGGAVKSIKPVQKFKTAALAVPRGACLSLLAINLWGMASSMYAWKKNSPQKYENVRNKWYKLGGNRTEFDRVIENGAKRKPLRFLFKKDMIKAKFTGQEQLPAAGVDDGAILGWISTGSTVLANLINVFKKSGGTLDAPQGTEMPPVDPEQQKQIDELEKQIEAGIVNPEEDNTLLWVAGIAAVLIIGGIIIYAISYSKKK
jgi:hypothetical protein